MKLPHLPQPEEIKARIDASGWGVFHDAIPTSLIKSMRDFWMPFYRSPKLSPQPVERGGIRLGAPNICSYTDNRFWRLYRNFDYLWNPATHLPTTELAIELHRLRNQVQGFSPEFGLQYAPENYGVYVSTSRYAADGGFLSMHDDGHQVAPLVHYMVPITFKFEDYDEGGMYIVENNGNRVEVDDICKPGSLIFFDGRIKHGVAPIKGNANSLGRIACFAIPTQFKTLQERSRMVRWIEDREKDIPLYLKAAINKSRLAARRLLPQ